MRGGLSGWVVGLMCFGFVLDCVLCVFGMFLGVCGSGGGVVLVHSWLLHVFD